MSPSWSLPTVLIRPRKSDRCGSSSNTARLHLRVSGESPQKAKHACYERYRSFVAKYREVIRMRPTARQVDSIFKQALRVADLFGDQKTADRLSAIYRGEEAAHGVKFCFVLMPFVNEGR